MGCVHSDNNRVKGLINIYEKIYTAICRAPIKDVVALMKSDGSVIGVFRELEMDEKRV